LGIYNSKTFGKKEVIDFFEDIVKKNNIFKGFKIGENYKEVLQENINFVEICKIKDKGTYTPVKGVIQLNENLDFENNAHLAIISHECIHASSFQINIKELKLGVLGARRTIYDQSKLKYVSSNVGVNEGLTEMYNQELLKMPIKQYLEPIIR